MNQASIVETRSESFVRFVPINLKKTFARRIVELFAGYDPELTEEERSESIRSVVKLFFVYMVCVLLAVGLLLFYLLA